jgi:NhaA family Na+:H+ antiporter
MAGTRGVRAQSGRLITKGVTAVGEFLRLEAAGGILLVLAGAAAMCVANSPWDNYYAGFLNLRAAIQLGPLEISKPFLLWINDGFMAVFFLLVGLELKREVLEGELSQLSQVVLPALAALGGIVVPAALYLSITGLDTPAQAGWAIPTATDIAFAVGVLSLLGNRVPSALKLFLLTLAIIDDLAAIVIIALFYSDKVSVASLGVASACIAILGVINVSGVRRTAPYIVVGLILWAAVLKSGIHATLAGVVVAAFIPLGENQDPHSSPLRRLEHDLHPWVAYGVLPLFAFANSGVPLAGASLATLLQPVPLGIAVGLFLGKQLGVFALSWLAIKTGLAKLPAQISWLHIYGAALLCGIGFTMSLFINTLAFNEDAVAAGGDGRIGIILGSLLAALTGYAVLRASSQQSSTRVKSDRS